MCSDSGRKEFREAILEEFRESPRCLEWLCEAAKVPFNDIRDYILSPPEARTHFLTYRSRNISWTFRHGGNGGKRKTASHVVSSARSPKGLTGTN